MTLIELARLGRDMRKLQKEFFATPKDRRPPDLLSRACEGERKFDEACNYVLGSHTLSLFGGSDDPAR